MSAEFTQYIDLAQVCLYLFWIFFFGLIYWLRKEDRREGYPLEKDSPRIVGNVSNLLFPSPKTFVRPDGSLYLAPDFERDTRDIGAERTARAGGAPLEPIGDPMLAAVGPGAYAERHDEPEVSIDGHAIVVPMRAAEGFDVAAGPDVRGWDVVAADGEVAGTVSEIWVDRVDMLVRYLEVELPAGAAESDSDSDDEEAGEASAATGDRQVRLVPMPLVVVSRAKGVVLVSAIGSAHFPHVPTTKDPDTITVLEEEKISAFYAGGLLYADPKRLGPLV